MHIPEIHKKCKKVFEKKLLGEESRSNACKMFDVMTDRDPDCDNSLGENFNGLIGTVLVDFFTDYKPKNQTSIEYYFNTYIFWMYLFVERIDFVFDVLNPKKEQNVIGRFKIENFKTCQLIIKWANFIKHPKEFWFTHWASYKFEGEYQSSENDIVIDSDFVRKHYSKGGRIDDLVNKNNVIVQVPELISLTEKFCDELNFFFDFVCNNKIVSDFLSKKTTRKPIYDTESGQLTRTEMLIQLLSEGVFEDEQ